MCVCASQLEGERERKSLGRGGGGAGKGREKLLGLVVRKGREEEQILHACMCVCSFHGFLSFLFFFFFDLSQQVFQTFRPDCGFIF